MRIKPAFLPVVALPLLFKLQACAAPLPQEGLTEEELAYEPKASELIAPLQPYTSDLSFQYEKQDSTSPNEALVKHYADKQLGFLMEAEPGIESLEPRDLGMLFLPQGHEAREKAIYEQLLDHYSRIFVPGSDAEKHALKLFESESVALFYDDFEALMHILDTHPVVNELVNAEGFARQLEKSVAFVGKELSELEQMRLTHAVFQHYNELRSLVLAEELLMVFGKSGEDIKGLQTIKALLKQKVFEIFQEVKTGSLQFAQGKENPAYETLDV